MTERTPPSAQPPSHRQAVGLVLAAAGLWSLGGVLIKAVEWHPLAIGGMRSAIAAATLLVLAPRPRFTRSVWLWAGAACYAATTVGLALAYKTTSAASAITLQYTAPVWVALLSWPLLRERPTRADWATLAAVAAGMLLFFWGDWGGSRLTGNLVALLTGATYAGVALCLRGERAGGRVELVLAGNLLAAVIGLPFGLPAWGGASWPDSTGWLALTAAGVVQLGLPYLLYARAIERVTALQASTLPMIEPVLVPLWVWIFLGEAPGWRAALGMSVVLGAVGLRALSAAREKPPDGG